MASDEWISSADVLRSAAHPLRLQLLALLDDEPQSPVRLARKLDVGVELVAYHVKRLQDAGLIELVETRKQRGATEHVYATTSRAAFADAAWAELEPDIRLGLVLPALQLLNARAVRAATEGGFDRAEAHFTRWALRLDEEGWRELAAATAEWVTTATAIEERAAARGSETLVAGLAVLLFEEPAPG